MTGTVLLFLLFHEWLIRTKKQKNDESALSGKGGNIFSLFTQP